MEQKAEQNPKREYEVVNVALKVIVKKLNDMKMKIEDLENANKKQENSNKKLQLSIKFWMKMLKSMGIGLSHLFL
jgi:hypothetical protein